MTIIQRGSAKDPVRPTIPNTPSTLPALTAIGEKNSAAERQAVRRSYTSAGSTTGSPSIFGGG